MRETGDRKTAAFTLLEVMIAVTIVTTSLVGLFSALIQISRLNATNREILAAMRAAEQMIETMKTTTFENVFASYNADPADDPLPGPGTAPGCHFDIPDLVPQPEDPDHKCGRILFPTDSTGRELRENVQDKDLGMPMDLDGNGTIDPTNVAATYKLLPVTIRIDWQGIQGKRTWSYRTILMRTRQP